MSFRQTLLILIIVLLFVSLGMIGWSYWPPAAEQNRVFIGPENMALPGSPDPQPEVLEFRTLTTLWPRSVRLGGSGLVHVDFAIDPVSRAGMENSQLLNVYDTHNILIDARLEMPNAVVTPSGLSSQPLLPGQTITFTWRIFPQEVEELEGTLWVYLRFVLRESGEQEQVPIVVKRIRVKSFALFGFPVGTVRIVGGLGLLMGTVFALPFLDDLLRQLWKRWGKT